MKRSSTTVGDKDVHQDDVTQEQMKKRASVSARFFGALDDFIKAGVLVIRDQEGFDMIREMSAQIATPQNSPFPPDAPVKPEQLDPPIRNLEGGPPGVKRRLVLEDAEEDEGVEEPMIPLFHLINTTLAGVAVPYDSRERDPITRAFQATIDALVTNSVERKQYLLEEIAKALIGTGSLEEYKERLRDVGHTWTAPFSE